MITSLLGLSLLSWVTCQSLAICKAQLFNLDEITKLFEVSVTFSKLLICSQLNGNQLNGTIPPELGKLEELFELWV